MIGLENLKAGKYYRFVREDDTFALGLTGEGETAYHKDLTKELGIDDKSARSPRIDMGWIGIVGFGENWRYIMIEGDSMSYDWPEEESFEVIRGRTVGILRETYPEIKIRERR